MAKCKLIEDKDYTGDGQTFYSNDGCLRPTGVFVPRIESLTYTPDVILWLHGWYVSGAKNGLEPAKGYETKLRDSVLASKKNVILIFPWLGKQTYRGEGTLGLHNLGGGSNLQQYPRHRPRLPDRLARRASHRRRDRTERAAAQL